MISSPVSKAAPSNLVSTPSSATGLLGGGSTGSTHLNTVRQLVGELSENLNVNGEEFAREEFDAKSFTSAIMKTNLLSQHLGKLSQSINALDKEIREQVSEHHEDLLHQAINIETLEEMLDMVQTRISSLKSTSERLRLKISTPFNELNLRILQLSRLQSACDMLRRIKGILHHAAKLRVHNQNGTKDIVKSAQCLNELDFLLRNFDASGIEVIEKDVHFVFKTRREVEEQAQTILDKSLVHQDQTQIGTALQVFYSLGILTDKLSQVLKANEKNFQKIATDLLDTVGLTLQSTNSQAHMQTSQSSSAFSTYGASSSAQSAQFPGRVTMPNVGSMSQFRAQLWTNIEKLMDNLFDSCSQIAQLQQIVEKKKDLLTNVFYIDEIDFGVIFSGKMYLSATEAGSYSTGEEGSFRVIQDSVHGSLMVFDSICSVINSNDVNSKKTIEFLYDHWRLLTHVLNSSILAACNQSNVVKQTLQNEYPKLLKLQNDLWQRLVQMYPMIDRYRYSGSSASGQTSGASAASGGSIKSAKLQQQQQKQASGSPASPSYQSSYELLRKCFYELENMYLNQSLSNLFKPIDQIFAQTSDKQINRTHIDNYLKGVQTQLQTLQYDKLSVNSATVQQIITTSSFTDKVVANICKTIQMYANKSEQFLNSLNADLQQALLASSNNAGSVGSGNAGAVNPLSIFSFASSASPNQVQMKNLDYVNVTHDLFEQMTRMFASEKLSEKLEGKLTSALNSLLVFEENALVPFIKSASDCILAIMLTMHQEDFNNPQSMTCSLYVRELQQVLQRICRDYLQLYNCKQILQTYLNELGLRCIELFIRHASILRPVSEQARKRLVNDSQQIEQLIQNQLCPKLTELGVAYKQMKAFRNLLKIGSPLKVEAPSSLGPDVADEQLYAGVLAESLPYHVLLHYLFSYATPELKSPHQSLDWSVQRYSEWLDKHTSDKERLAVVKSCLEAYVNNVRKRNEKKFDPIYALIFRLLETSVQSSSS